MFFFSLDFFCPVLDRTDFFSPSFLPRESDSFFCLFFFARFFFPVIFARKKKKLPIRALTRAEPRMRESGARACLDLSARLISSFSVFPLRLFPLFSLLRPPVSSSLLLHCASPHPAIPSLSTAPPPPTAPPLAAGTFFSTPPLSPQSSLSPPLRLFKS